MGGRGGLLPGVCAAHGDGEYTAPRTLAVQKAQPSSVGGLWAQEPWRVIALGTFYYATIAVTELFGVGAPPAFAPPRQGDL